MHQHLLPALQLRLNHSTQLVKALQQVLIALIPFRDMDLVDAVRAQSGQGLVREIVVHDGEDEVDFVGVVAREVFGGVGSVGRRDSVSTGGSVMSFKYWVEGERGGEGRKGRTHPPRNRFGMI